MLHPRLRVGEPGTLRSSANPSHAGGFGSFHSLLFDHLDASFKLLDPFERSGKMLRELDGLRFG